MWTRGPGWRPSDHTEGALGHRLHAAHFAIHYSLQSRADYLLETHLPDNTRDLAEAVDTNHAKNTSLRVDVYGYSLKTVTGEKYDGIR